MGSLPHICLEIMVFVVKCKFDAKDTESMIFYAKKTVSPDKMGERQGMGVLKQGADCSPSPYFCYFETEGRMIVGYFNKTEAKFAFKCA